MNAEEIRSIIRQSIKEQVKNLVEERLNTPSSFEKFSFLVRESLYDHKDKLSHEEIYGMWKNISSEISNTQGNEMISEWNASLKYYLDALETSSQTKSMIFNHLKR